MAFSHVNTKSVQSPSGKLSRSATYMSSSQVEVSEAVPAGVFNSVLIAIDVSEVVSFVMQSDLAITVNANSDEFDIPAGGQYQWDTNSYAAFALTADVTEMLISVGGSDPADVEIRVLQDSTP